MGGDAGARQIEEYYPKSVFTRRYPGVVEAFEGLNSATERLDSLLGSLSSRRSFIDHGYMERVAGGARYWRT